MTDSLLPSQPPLPSSFWQQLSKRQFKHLAPALRQKQFRNFLLGQFLSNIGSWMQSIAQAWLVLQMTNSAFYLGLDGFANTLPISIFALWGGVVADRFDRRRLLLATQWIFMVLALLLGVLTLTKKIQVWQVIAFSFLTGLTQAVAWPVYQAVVANMVEADHLSNAIALNSTQFNMARTVGPMMGALALSLFGTAGCFFANAVSFVPVIVTLAKMRLDHKDRRLPGRMSFFQSFREGFGYMRQDRTLFWLLLTLSASSVLGVPMVTLLPVYARDILQIGASGLGVLVASFGAGAVLGGIVIAWAGNFTYRSRFVLRTMLIYVAGMLVFAASRNLLVSVICLFITGFSMVCFASVVNTIIQASVPDHLRGRAMSVFVFAFGGCMPFGNLLAGDLARRFGAPAALLSLGAVLGCFTLYVYGTRQELRRQV